MKVGQTMDIIYLDRNEQITQRHIRVITIKGHNVLAFDVDKRAPRSFSSERILASQVSQRAYS
jgi:predicted DNA-binding transcriptional regulator YafY